MRAMKNMTPEHAKAKLEQLRQLHEADDPILCGALDIAIAAIEKADCDDCISRDAVAQLLSNAGLGTDVELKLQSQLADLPAVAPKTKIAEWIVQ